MGFWEDFSAAVTKAADKTVKETEKLTTVAKLKYRVSSVKKELNELYETMGQLKYAELNGTDVSAEDYEAIAETIAEHEEKLVSLEDRLEELNEYTNCPRCGYRVKKTASECACCGCEINDGEDGAKTAAANEADAAEPEKNIGEIADEITETIIEESER